MDEGCAIERRNRDLWIMVRQCWKELWGRLEALYGASSEIMKSSQGLSKHGPMPRPIYVPPRFLSQAGLKHETRPVRQRPT